MAFPILDENKGGGYGQERVNPQASSVRTSRQVRAIPTVLRISIISPEHPELDDRQRSKFMDRVERFIMSKRIHRYISPRQTQPVQPVQPVQQVQQIQMQHVQPAQRVRHVRQPIIKREYESLSQSIICPICTDTMTNPVIISSGVSYCHQCITTWLHNHNTCPATNIIVSKQVIPNITLRNMIDSISK